MHEDRRGEGSRYARRAALIRLASGRNAPLRAVLFDLLYRLGLDAWNIGAPQPDLVRLHQEGILRGRVLDVGCGTGDNAIFLARQGCEVTGIDFVRRALDIACTRAAREGVAVTFEQANAFDLAHLGTFDAVLDYGLMHQFRVPTARRYVASLRGRLAGDGALVVQCLAPVALRLTPRPRGLTREDIEETFADRWRIEVLRPARYRTRSGDEHSAWLAVVRSE